MSEEEGTQHDGASSLMGLFDPPTSPLNDHWKKAAFAPIPEQEETFVTQAYQSFEALQSYDDINRAEADIDAPAGSIGYMMGLFSRSGENSQSSDHVISSREDAQQMETTPLLIPSTFGWKEADTPKAGVRNRKQYENGKTTHHIRLPSVPLPVIDESVPPERIELARRSSSWMHRLTLFSRHCAKEAVKPTTLVGSFIYLLYHVVFCLALGSAIIRPHSSTNLLGLMTKTAALGTVSSTLVYLWGLASEIPALYPTVDLFLAPFLANLAVIVDEALSNDKSVTPLNNDAVFLATFGFLSAIGICFSGLLLSLSGVFKLANLGSFLPFPVICGFFSAVGILIWTLAITVDTGGKTIGYILKSGDPQLLLFAIIHHVPSVAVACIMKYLGPKNPFFVVVVVLGTIGLFYLVLFAMDISYQEAKEMGWFWPRNELVYSHAAPSDLPMGSPPSPFGVVIQLSRGFVHWGSVADGLSTATALGFLYVIRCSVHGAALKKNIPNMTRTIKATVEVEEKKFAPSPRIPRPIGIPSRKFSEAVDIEAVVPAPSNKATSTVPSGVTIEHARPSNISLKSILTTYGISQLVSAIFGGFAITPAVAASTTMFSLGAHGIAPQIGSVLLLLVFYLTDFQLVEYIPKPAFSSMLVLSCIDMIYTWFYKSYFKTNDKFEWMVVPAIVLCAFVFDLLTAVFLGIAFSTFIFVGSFNRSGVVKYVANGAVIRSTIERPFRKGDWLSDNGDFIQIIVLQNYLFFGNASTVYNYFASMFLRSVGGANADSFACRKPKYLILDMTLITGMDTSTVDIFNEIKNLCSSNNCKLFVTGLTSNFRSILSLGGFKPEEMTQRSERKLRFFASLDAALGKAEDLLLEAECDDMDVPPAVNRMGLLSEGGDLGFRIALSQIDEEHGDKCSLELLEWQHHTKVVELNPGDQLYKSGEEDMERGLFFVESGVLKIEQDASATLGTRAGTQTSPMKKDPRHRLVTHADSTLSKIQAMEYATILAASQQNSESQTFRLARIGPGWIAGTVEAVSGRQRPGFHIAVTHCRLHHLPFSKIVEMEKENPALVLSLYKLLAYMMARRQESTIGQLATFHSIMTSPASQNQLMV